MRPLPDFELQRPASVDAALALLASPGARAVAGGTDLLPNLRRGLGLPRLLVDLGALPGSDAIEHDAEGWRIGAGVTLAALAAHAGVALALPALAQAAAAIAGPGHRSAATVGGNLCQDTRCIYYNQSAWWRAANQGCLKHGGSVCHVAPQGSRCHAAYEGDLAPALMVLGAEAELASAAPEGGAARTRRLPLAALYRDDGRAHLALLPGELLLALQLPAQPPGSVSGYRKQRVRGAMDFPLAGVAMRLERGAGGELAGLAVAVSGTDSRPLAIDGCQALLGRPVDEAAARALSRLVQQQVSPMRSTAGAAHHRRLVAAVAASRLLAELWQESAR